MKEFVISEVKTETAVLVGLITKDQDEAKTTEYLDELEFLADTAGAVTVKRFTQRVGGPSAITYVGSGKLQEIRCQDSYGRKGRAVALVAPEETHVCRHETYQQYRRHNKLRNARIWSADTCI